MFTLTCASGAVIEQSTSPSAARSCRMESSGNRQAVAPDAGTTRDRSTMRRRPDPRYRTSAAHLVGAHLRLDVTNPAGIHCTTIRILQVDRANVTHNHSTSRSRMAATSSGCGHVAPGGPPRYRIVRSIPHGDVGALLPRCAALVRYLGSRAWRCCCSRSGRAARRAPRWPRSSRSPGPCSCWARRRTRAARRARARRRRRGRGRRGRGRGPRHAAAGGLARALISLPRLRWLES